MIAVSNAYKDAINADQRYVVPRVEVYFDGKNQAPTVFDADTVVSLNVLEELMAESGSPLGSISSNELTITLSNTNGRFNPDNVNSPYYGKLMPDIQVKPFLGIETSPGIFEYIPLGVFYTGDWKPSNENLSVTITCYDILYKLLNKEAPDLPMRINLSLGEFLEIFLQNIGLSSDEYILDATLYSHDLQYAYALQGPVRDTLNEIVKCNINITCDRYGRAKFIKNNTSPSIAETWREGNQIFNINNLNKAHQVYKTVTLNYIQPIVLQPQCILRSDTKVKVPQGNSTFGVNKLSDKPIAILSQVRIINADTYTNPTSLKLGTWGCTLTLNNSQTIVPYEECDIEIWAQVLDEKQKSTTASVSNNSIDKSFITDCYLIQDDATANTIVNELLEYLSTPNNLYSIQARGNPALELNDVIQIDSQSTYTPLTDVKIIKQEIIYDGTLSCDIEAVAI